MKVPEINYDFQKRFQLPSFVKCLIFALFSELSCVWDPIAQQF